HPDLPSFPTRRSSDLRPAVRRHIVSEAIGERQLTGIPNRGRRCVSGFGAQPVLVPCLQLWAGDRAQDNWLIGLGVAFLNWHIGRSEEHTSELQSLAYL